MQALLDYVRPDDSVVDVGGGAGRLGLPLALRCRELINVDPSGGMKQVFDAVAAEAGIKNARYVQSDWLDAQGIAGDLTLVADVTYFIADIVPFIQKLQAASRRRVMIVVASEPPPNTSADLFRAVHGEELAPLPGHRQLLPVLWVLGILPELRVYEPMAMYLAMHTFASRQEIIEASSTSASLPAVHRERVIQALESHFDELFVAVDGGFRRRQQSDLRQLLITWDTEG